MGGKARVDPREAGELGEGGTDRREGRDRAEQTRDPGKEGPGGTPKGQSRL